MTEGRRKISIRLLSSSEDGPPYPQYKTTLTESPKIKWFWKFSGWALELQCPLVFWCVRCLFLTINATSQETHLFLTLCASVTPVQQIFWSLKAMSKPIIFSVCGTENMGAAWLAKDLWVWKRFRSGREARLFSCASGHIKVGWHLWQLGVWRIVCSF